MAFILIIQVYGYVKYTTQHLLHQADGRLDAG
mgnify:FL=1